MGKQATIKCLAAYDLGWLCRCQECRPHGYCRFCGAALEPTDPDDEGFEPVHGPDCSNR